MGGPAFAEPLFCGLRSLRRLKELKEFKELRELKALKEFKAFKEFKVLKEFKGSGERGDGSGVDGERSRRGGEG